MKQLAWWLLRKKNLDSKLLHVRNRLRQKTQQHCLPTGFAKSVERWRVSKRKLFLFSRKPLMCEIQFQPINPSNQHLRAWNNLKKMSLKWESKLEVGRGPAIWKPPPPSNPNFTENGIPFKRDQNTTHPKITKKKGLLHFLLALHRVQNFIKTVFDTT
jgi:hypothetical protein